MRNFITKTVLTLVLLSAFSVFGLDRQWIYTGSGSGSNPAYWDPYGVPTSSDKAILPNIGQFYTVTTDAAWILDDLSIGRFATGHANGYNLTVYEGGDVWGTLKITDAYFAPGSSLSLNSGTGYGGTLWLENANVMGGVSTSSNSVITGYGYIDDGLSNNRGLITAQGGVLSIRLTGNDHDNDTLSAGVGATLSLRNTSNLINRATINLAGGIITPQTGTYNLENRSSSLITGYGTINNYRVENLEGAVLAPTSGTLYLSEGFANNIAQGTINLASGGTLSVGNQWSLYGQANMTGGSIVGERLTRGGAYGEILVSSGITNTIENVLFQSTTNYGAVISNGAALTITGTGTLSSTTIDAGTGGGKLNVGDGAVIEGRGTIRPNMDISGTLTANSSGNSLNVDGNVIVLTGGAAMAQNTGTLNLNGNITNRANVIADGGLVVVSGAVIASSDATGDFSANSSQMNLSGATFQDGTRNTFTANTGGTILLPDELSTSQLYLSDAIRPRGGTISTQTPGSTLTNASGKIISGYGQLIESERNLLNEGVIEAAGGTFNIYGTLTNNGSVSTSGNSVAVIQDSAPTGNGTFTANTSGTVRFSDGFTNANLSNEQSIHLQGGKLEVSDNGTMTNHQGRTIGGYGTLLQSGQTIINEGTLKAEGMINSFGFVNNSGGEILVSATDGYMVFNGGLTNTGLLEVNENATISGTNMTVTSIGNQSGRILLNEANMTATQLLINASGFINDNSKQSVLNISASVSNKSDAFDDFSLTNSTLAIASQGLIGLPQTVEWMSLDTGAELAGLSNNMAIGSLVFGGGLGSTNAQLTGNTVMYCYGLEILGNAHVDLGGNTIYYLREGVEYNGITGQGFSLTGSYDNGQIIEIVPEPSAFLILAIGGLLLKKRKILKINP